MGELAVAWTEGFQAPRPSKLNPPTPATSGGTATLLQGVITLKHMVANSLENTEPFNRHNFDANVSFGVSPYVLADYYLRPFAAAIGRADARGVMCSYNAVLGKPTCLSPLMRNARQAWGFRGYVTSDSDSVQNAWADHGYPPHDNGVGATALALTDGQCDIDSGDTYNERLAEAVAGAVDGVSMSDVDRALTNSLRQRFDLGLFDPKEAYEWPTVDDVGTDASSALSLDASRESLVLLRNDGGLLPLSRGTRIAVVGPHATAREVMTQPYPFKPYCPPAPHDDAVKSDPLACITSPYAAISQINGAPSLTTTAPGCDLFNESTDGFAEALALAAAADVVVLGLGIETCGLTPAHNVNPERPGRCYQEKSTSGYVFPDQYTELEAHDRTTIDLPPVQHAFAKAVLALNKPTVLFLMNAGAVAIDLEDGSQRDGAPLAIVEAFYPGVRGGEAMAEGLFGEMNAWGRMPYTIYPLSFEKAAAMTMHDLRITPGRTYRYYREPTYPFGAGLTLTNWTIGGTRPACLDALPTASAEVCTLALQVTNAGQWAGDCVVLGYFRSLLSDADWLARRNSSRARAWLPHGIDPAELLTPQRQLFDFARLKRVAPGETRTMTISISAKTLAMVDEGSGDLVASAGSFHLLFDSGAGFIRGAVGEAAKADGAMLSWHATVTGSNIVVSPFPSSEA